MEKTSYKVEFKNLRLTLYKFIVVVLVLLHYCGHYRKDTAGVLETLLYISTALVLVGELIKLFEKEKTGVPNVNDNFDPGAKPPEWFNQKDVLGNDKPES
jgi:hypothetical protein